MVAPIAQSIGFDAAAAEAAVALAIEQRWLIGTGKPPHSVCLTDEGRNLAIINGYSG
jgi:triosephosphate isomerase